MLAQARPLCTPHGRWQLCLCACSPAASARPCALSRAVPQAASRVPRIEYLRLFVRNLEASVFVFFRFDLAKFGTGGQPCQHKLFVLRDNRKCPCHRSSDAYGDHVSTCCRFLATWTQGHDHIQACVVQDQHYVPDLYVSRLALNEIRGVAIAISTVHDFHGSADSPQRRMAPCAILTLTALSQRAGEKVDEYREGYTAPGMRHAFLPAVVFTSGRIPGELLRLLFHPCRQKDFPFLADHGRGRRCRL